jgi:hypothetical protein
LTADDDTGDDAARLERALERIAVLSRRREGPGPAPDGGEMAERLDTLIAQLRAAIGPSE